MVSKPDRKPPLEPDPKAHAHQGILCERCQSEMNLAARIEPFGNEPGLTAFECPACGAVRSFLVPRGARISRRAETGN
jgi:hypothetical protein